MPKTSIDPSAEVSDDAVVEDSIVEAGAIVGRKATLVQSVLEERAEVGRRAIAEYALIRSDASVGDAAELRGTRAQEVVVSRHSAIGPSCVISKGARVGTVVSGPAADEILDVQWASHALPAAIGDSTHVGEFAQVSDSVTGFECVVGHAAVVAGSRLLDNVRVGRHSWVLNTEVKHKVHIGEGARIIDADRIESDTDIGDRCEVGQDALIGSHVRLGDNVGVLTRAKVRNFVTVGVNSSIGRDCVISSWTGRVEDGVDVANDCILGPRVRVESNVTIEEGVRIEADAVIESGAYIGAGALIGAAYVVSENEQVPPNAELTGARETFREEEHFPVAPTAEAFVYSRLAEVAGSGRLTKEKLKRERPELLEHPIAKDALRARPRPTGEELGELADQASRGIRYHVKIRPGGWRGGQRLGERASDLILFNITPEVMRGLVAHMEEEDQPPVHQAILQHIEAENIHFDPRTVGWVRLQTYCDKGAIVIEELQTDIKVLRMVMGDPSRIDEVLEEGYFRSVPCIPFDELREEQKGAVGRAYLDAYDMEAVLERMKTEKEQVWREIAQWFEDRCQAWRNVLIATHDIYEVMLSTVLDMASGRIETSLMDCDIDSVYLLTHETKSRIRAAGRPPTYPYSKLYKMFQSARKLELPAWVDTSGFEVVEHSGSSDPWEPPATHRPQARLLRPNE